MTAETNKDRDLQRAIRRTTLVLAVIVLGIFVFTLVHGL